MMRPTVTMRRALSDPQLLGCVLPGDSWAAWRTMLIAIMGEPLTDEEAVLFRRLTGGREPPTEPVHEGVFVIGRRGGKDRAASVLSTYLAALCDWSGTLVTGERGVVVCIGPDQRQAKITRDYVEGVFDQSPLLSHVVQNKTADTIDLDNGTSIEVRAASFRRLRGVTAIAVIATEAAFWHSEEASTNTDAEILNAVRPALATTGGPLILISSPYAKQGELYEAHRRNYGPDGDPLILVAQGASRVFNTTLSEKFVQRALERDPEAARAEYLGEFRDDISAFISSEAIAACVTDGVIERLPDGDCQYVGFVDAAGGSGADSFTAGIAHRDRYTGNAVLDAVREHRPPFSPAFAVEELATFFKSYGVTSIVGDRWGGEFPREMFRQHGVDYFVSDLTKSDLYRELIGPLNSRAIDLLDHKRLLGQLRGLERRVARGGKDSIDHGPNAHDDIANCAAGALYSAALTAREYTREFNFG